MDEPISAAKSALEGLRVGCVQYLNSRPLIHGLEDVLLAHPSVLASKMRAGKLEVALVPVFEWLRSPADYVAVDGVGIASRGAVLSVFVAHRGPLELMKAVIADPASLTSVHLVQVLCRGILGREVPMVSEAEGDQFGDHVGRLWIGNQALDFRQNDRGADWQYWDLGEAWTRWTGLPFVYALWILRRSVCNSDQVAIALREVGSSGIAALDKIIHAQNEYSVELAQEYLRRRICFEIGDAEKRGLSRFRSALKNSGFLNSEAGSNVALDWV